MFKRENRLAKELDIKQTLKKGRSIKGRFLGLKVLKNNLEVSRFAVVVGVKVSKRAVERNRLRRQIRSVIEPMVPKMKKGFDVMVMVRSAAKDQDFETIEAEVKGLIKDAKLL